MPPISHPHKLSIHLASTYSVGLSNVVWSELGLAPPSPPMRVLELQWSLTSIFFVLFFPLLNTNWKFSCRKNPKYNQPGQNNTGSQSRVWSGLQSQWTWMMTVPLAMQSDTNDLKGMANSLTPCLPCAFLFQCRLTPRTKFWCGVVWLFAFSLSIDKSRQAYNGSF